MRNLKLQVQVSLDSLVADENGGLDWMVWDWDDELKNYVAELTAPVDLILLGRKIAEGFIDAWTARSDDPESGEFARKMIETPKIVFSRSNAKIERKNTVTADGKLVEKITELKQAEGGDIIVYGGAEFVGSLIANNLIDEYQIFVNPVALGKGMSIFGGLEKFFNLRLRESKAFECGIVVSVYEPERF